MRMLLYISALLIGSAVYVSALAKDDAPMRGSYRSRKHYRGDVNWFPKVEEECTYALNFIYLQDLSQSFTDDIPYVQEQVPQLVEELAEEYPFSRFAMASFSDHPFPDVGYGAAPPRDYCFKLEFDFTTNVSLVEEEIEGFVAVSGRDQRECQLDTILHAAKGGYFPNEGWTPEGHPIVRVISVATDAPYHIAGDLAYALTLHDELRVTNPELFSSDEEYSVVENNGDGVLKCEGFEQEDYPTIEQMALALKDEEVMMIFTVTSDQYSRYVELVDILEEYGIWGDVVTIEENSENLLQSIKASLTELHELICHFPTTTTTTTVALATDTQASSSLADSPTTEEHETPGGVTDDCVARAVVDFFLVFDSTNSFSNDIPVLNEQMPILVDDFAKNFFMPRYGLARFADKPIHPLGAPENDDFCYRHVLHLDYETEQFLEEIGRMTAHSGIDWKESQLDALISAASSTISGWRSEDYISVLDQQFPVLRVLALSTDSGYHVAGDGLVVDPSLLPNPGDGTFECLEHDYPSLEQVRDALLLHKVQPLFLVTAEMVPKYEHLAKYLEDYGVYAAVEELAEDSSNIIDAIKGGTEDLCRKVLSGQDVEGLGRVAREDVGDNKQPLVNAQGRVKEVFRSNGSLRSVSRNSA